MHAISESPVSVSERNEVLRKETSFISAMPVQAGESHGYSQMAQESCLIDGLYI